MIDVNEILRANPRAAAGFDTVRKTLDDVARLRESGFATGPNFTRPDGERMTLNDLRDSQRRGTFPTTTF